MKKTWSAFLILVLSSIACKLFTKPAVVVLPTTTSLPPTAMSIPPTATPDNNVVIVPPLNTVEPVGTATAEQTGQYFTEEFDGDISHWSMLPTQGKKEMINVSTEKSSLVFDITGVHLGAILTYDTNTYSDVRIDARVDNVGRVDGSYGLICRYDGSRWYEFDITTTGLYQISYGYWNAGKASAKYQLIADGATDLTHTGRNVNEITAICNGTSLSLLINGKEARTVTETQWRLYVDGNIAITASALERAPFEAAFDWVKVGKP